MRKFDLQQLSDIARMRAVQRDAAEIAAGQAEQASRSLGEQRHALEQAVGFAVDGYRRNLTDGRFDNALAENWRLAVVGCVEDLGAHDATLAKAKLEADRKAKDWHLACGRSEQSETVKRETLRKVRRHQDEEAMTDAADLLLSREFVA